MEHAGTVPAAGNRPLALIAGRYLIGESFAAGGMGTVHLGRIVGAGGFSRVVAIKRLYPTAARDRAFRELLLEEARLASRIRHPNVVPTLDVVEEESDLYIVMEYAHGPSLAQLLKRAREINEPLPVGVTVGIIEAVLRGLHAAHEARGEDGTPLGIVHRDVSPHNILVGTDGVSRLIDFGIAKAATRIQMTDPGMVRGKMGYMAPEQFLYQPVSRHTDVYTASVVLWEALANRRLFEGRAEELNQGGHKETSIRRAVETKVLVPTHYRPVVGAAIDEVVMRGLELEPRDRFPTAEAMAVALRRAHAAASPVDVARWLERFATDELELAEERVRLLEQTPRAGPSNENVSEVVPIVGWSAASAGPTEPRRASRARWIAIGVATLAVAMIAVAIGASAPRQGSTPAGASQTSTSSLAEPVKTGSGAALQAAASTRPAEAENLTGAATERLGSAARASSRVSPSGSSPRPIRKTARAECDPPYTIDANGHKHYNPNCF